MGESAPPTMSKSAEASKPPIPRFGAAEMAPLLQRLAGRLRRLGLTVSLWDPAGNPLVEPAFHNELCRQFCGQKRLCLEAMSGLAQKVCQADAPELATAPTGCCLLAVPMHQRRRRIGAAVACLPIVETPETEEFARACTQAGLDRQFAAGLCRKATRHDAVEAETLCLVLKWLIQDEQAKEIARQELTTLSTNLANTYEELSLLYRISGSMKVNQSATEFFENLCRELREVMRLEAAAVALRPREHSGLEEEVVWAGELPLEPDQLAQIVRRYLSPRVGASARAIVENHFAEDAAHLGPQVGRIQTLIAVPLMSAENCKGILLGINKIGAEFDSIDLKLISSIGSQAGVFLENHHLYEDRQDLLMGVLHALTASIDAKDPYTCGHSRRVAEVSKKLARLCGFDEQRAERVYLAGLLHDIGKIGMPESVLCKTGKLNEEEYAKVKLHPEVGATILSGMRQTEDVLPILRHHHERPDGRGYPAGLAGREIPIEALIVGLADSFDAMTSCRTYRSAMPLEAVIVEIRRCSGTQFDSHLVELLLSIDLEAFLAELRELDHEANVVSARS